MFVTKLGLRITACFIAACISSLKAQVSTGVEAATALPASLTLTGTAERPRGNSVEQGTFSLSVGSDGSYQEVLVFPSSSTTYTAGPAAMGRECTVSTGSGEPAEDGSPNCFRALPWFAGWLADSFQSAGLLTSLAGVVASNGVAARTLQMKMGYPPKIAAKLGKHADALLLQSSAKVTTDPQSGFISTYTCMETALEGHGLLQTDVRYENFQRTQGVAIPYQITRYLQGTKNLVLHVNAVSAN